MIGGTELWIIMGILVAIFGAKRLPEIGKGVGEAIKNFKKSMSEPSEQNPPAHEPDKEGKKD